MNRPAEARSIDRIDEAHRNRVDEALRSWRQGDCVLGDQAFLFRLNPVAPISAATAMTRRMSRKHDARSDEGRALRALREIRVRAAPSWRADEVDLLFLFVRDDTAQTFAGQTWDCYLDQWLRRVWPAGRFTRIDRVVQTLDDLTGPGVRRE